MSAADFSDTGFYVNHNLELDELYKNKSVTSLYMSAPGSVQIFNSSLRRVSPQTRQRQLPLLSHPQLVFIGFYILLSFCTSPSPPQTPKPLPMFRSQQRVGSGHQAQGPCHGQRPDKLENIKEAEIYRPRCSAEGLIDCRCSMVLHSAHTHTHTHTKT